MKRGNGEMNTFYRHCICLFFFYAHCNISDVFPLHLIVVVIDDDFKNNFRIKMHFKTQRTEEESTC